MSKSVWLLVDSLTFGGIETHIVELAQGLKSFDVPVQVVLVERYSSPAEIITRLECNSIEYHYLEELGTSLRDAVKTHSPTVVHSHGYKANILAKLSLPFSSVKLVSTFHAGETPAGRVRIYDMLDRYTAFLASTNLCVSDKIQAKLPFKSEVIKNFIQMPESMSHTADKHFGFVGRLSPEKGPDIFIELAVQCPQYAFHLYGDGPLRNELEQAAPKNVVFEGFQTDMSSVYPRLDLLLITSRYEGLPMTALEAMARGVPVASLDVGDISKLVKHNQNGFVVSDVEALANCLSNWESLSNSEKQAIQTSARNTIEKEYSVTAVIPELLEHYHLKLDSQYENQSN